MPSVRIVIMFPNGVPVCNVKTLACIIGLFFLGRAVITVLKDLFNIIIIIQVKSLYRTLNSGCFEEYR